MNTPIPQDQVEEIRTQLYPEGVSRELIAERLLLFVETEGDLLPAADSPLRQLGRELYRDDVGLDRCEKIIATDAALTYLVLRAADMASLGSRKFTVPYAVMFLGLARLRVLFGVEVLKRMTANGVSKAWVPFWERNLFVARFLERLAVYYYPVDGTEYLAGLLHDASWPATVTFFKREYGILFDEPDALFHLEKEIFPVPHAAISAAMCVRSGLPGHVVDAVAQHHDALLPDETRMKGLKTLRYNGPFLGVLLQIANRVADAQGFPPSGDSTRTQTMADVLASPEVAWISTFGLPPNLERTAHEELQQVRKAQGLFLPAV